VNGRRRFLELLVLGGCAFILTGALLSMVLTPGDTPTEGSPVWKLIRALSYLSVAAILVPYYRETLFVVRRNGFVVALVLLALVSCLWAAMPALVLERSVAVCGTTLLGIALAVRLSLEEQLRLLSWSFRIMSVLSLACIFLLPSYGISDSAAHEWRGIFGYKNVLGSIMAMSILVEWQRPAHTPFSRTLRWLALLLSAVLLFFSGSITPALALGGSIVLIEIYKVATRLRIPLYATVLATVLMVSSGMVLGAKSEAIVGALGRSSDLTGRTEIWSLVLSYIAQRPIAGYGYSGFWLGAAPESAQVNQAMRGLIMYSHNGYLEILISLGIVGLVLTLAVLGIGVKRALSFSEQSQAGIELWPLAFLLYLILHNLGECSIFIQDIEWAICVSSIAGTDPMLLPIDDQQEGEWSLVPIEEPT
jgi:exopolysaccharide production protein ExoQ